MKSLRKKTVSLVLAASLGTTVLQLGGCSLGAISSILGRLNPCSVILACDPAVFAFISSDFDEPGANPSVDPFCTFPPFCDTSVDPIFGPIGPIP